MRLTKKYEDGSFGVADDLPCGENSHDFKDLLIQTLGQYEEFCDVEDIEKVMAEEIEEPGDLLRRLDEGFLLLNNHVKIGDIISDNHNTIRVEEIGIHRSIPPQCIYSGAELTKKGKDKKYYDIGSVYQSNIKRINGVELMK